MIVNKGHNIKAEIIRVSQSVVDIILVFYGVLLNDISVHIVEYCQCPGTFSKLQNIGEAVSRFC